MKLARILVFTMILLLASALHGWTWSITVENKCTPSSGHDGHVSLQAFSHRITEFKSEGNASLRPGDTVTFPMTGGWCPAYLEVSLWRKLACMKGIPGTDMIGIPCCWDVYYEATGKGSQCTVRLK